MEELVDATDLATFGGDRGAVAKALGRLLKKGCWLGLGLDWRLETEESRLGGVLEWFEDLVGR